MEVAIFNWIGYWALEMRYFNSKLFSMELFELLKESQDLYNFGRIFIFSLAISHWLFFVSLFSWREEQELVIVQKSVNGTEKLSLINVIEFSSISVSSREFSKKSSKNHFKSIVLFWLSLLKLGIVLLYCFIILQSFSFFNFSFFLVFRMLCLNFCHLYFM